jgi:putative DNA-invertase from lambdoid prophage Rac
MRVALYHRVSTIDQRPELARRELRAAARTRGARVVLSLEETGSGARADRPGWERVMAAARAGSLDAVMVWKLDRAGRSQLDLLASVETLHRCGVAFIATSQGLEFRGDATGRLLLGCLAACAEFERSLIRERTRQGLAGARSRGVKLGRPARAVDVDGVRVLLGQGIPLAAIARGLGLPRTTLRDRLAEKGGGSTPLPTRSELRLRARPER